MAPIGEIETFHDCTELKKTGKIALLSDINSQLKSSCRSTFQHKPTSSWSLMALFLPGVKQYY